MDERGLISMMAVWLALAAATIGLAVIDSSRQSVRRAANGTLSVHALCAATTVAVLAYSSQFSEPVIDTSLDGCVVHATRRLDDNGQSAVLTCEVTVGHLRKIYDIGWKRIGAEWRADWWNER